MWYGDSLLNAGGESWALVVDDRRSFAWVDPNCLRDWDSHDRFLSLGDPHIIALLMVKVVVMLMLHRHGSDEREQAGNGKKGVGMHVDAL